MNKEEIKNILIKIFKNFNIKTELLDSTREIRNLEIDSLKLFEIIVAVEDEFKISFYVEDLYNLKTFFDLVNLLDKYLN